MYFLFIPSAIAVFVGLSLHLAANNPFAPVEPEPTQPDTDWELREQIAETINSLSL